MLRIFRIQSKCFLQKVVLMKKILKIQILSSYKVSLNCFSRMLISKHSQLDGKQTDECSSWDRTPRYHPINYKLSTSTPKPCTSLKVSLVPEILHVCVFQTQDTWAHRNYYSTNVCLTWCTRDSQTRRAISGRRRRGSYPGITAKKCWMCSDLLRICMKQKRSQNYGLLIYYFCP